MKKEVREGRMKKNTYNILRKRKIIKKKHISRKRQDNGIRRAKDADFSNKTL